MIAASAIMAAYVMRWALPRVREPLWRLVSNLAMVGAGAAMFFMSSGQILVIHEAWAAVVRSNNEGEFQLYWGGRRRFVLEWEQNGSLVIERQVDPDDLPARFRPDIDRLARTGRIVMIEEVRGWSSLSVEVYVQSSTEVTAYDLH